MSSAPPPPPLFPQMPRMHARKDGGTRALTFQPLDSFPWHLPPSPPERCPKSANEQRPPVSPAGVVLPSLSSLPYLLSFQLVCTWWAWSGSLPPLLFRALSLVSLAYSAAHFLLVYSYQLPSLREAWPPGHPSAR